MIDSRRDGVSAISETLAKRSGLEAVHIIMLTRRTARCSSGAQLDFETLVERAAQIKKWGDALSANGDILFYGCDLAATTQGQSLIDAIARLTGADVAASENPTGASAKGGDWDARVPGRCRRDAERDRRGRAPGNGTHLLNTYYRRPNTNYNSGSGTSLRQAIADANANGGLDTIVFDISSGPSGSVKTITVNSTLTITDSVIIDGRTEDGLRRRPAHRTRRLVDCGERTRRCRRTRVQPRHGKRRFMA